MVSAAGEDTARVHLLDINGGPSGGHVFELPRDEVSHCSGVKRRFGSEFILHAARHRGGPHR